MDQIENDESNNNLYKVPSESNFRESLQRAFDMQRQVYPDIKTIFEVNNSYKSISDRVSELSTSSILSSLYSNLNLPEMNRSHYFPDYLQSNNKVFSEKNKLEETINKISKELREKTEEIKNLEKDDQSKEEKINELSLKIKEYESKRLLSHLLPRVNEQAQNKLIDDSSFAEKFKLNTMCTSVVLSIDIRDSTQLMLNAKTPESFARFITSLSVKLTQLVTDNYGVYDKFTGDGLLCFFPDFFSGNDAIYYALKTAAEAHQLFIQEYRESYQYFSVVRADVGLGIGIDIGETCLTSISNDLTVVGKPVVYACRLSSAPANHTLLNQTAFEKIMESYSPFYKSEIQCINFKNQGIMVAYDVDLNFDAIKPKKPDWSLI